MTNKTLRKIILSMVEADQAMRRNTFCDLRVDERHTRRFKAIVRKHGWPTISLVGESGAKGAWLLAQHADHDVRFQQLCLDLLRTSAREGEADKKHVAYLTDRILKNKNKPQIFGTQFYLNRRQALVPWKIRRIRYLEERRREVGLDSFRHYRKTLLAEEQKLTKKVRKKALRG